MPQKNRLYENSGSALILAVLLVSVILIFGASVLGLAEMASRSASSQVNSEQAYFTAKSGADAIVAYLKNPATTNDDIVSLLGRTSTSVDMPPGMGLCTVSLSSVQTAPVYDAYGNYTYSETITVSSLGVFGGAEKTYTAVLTRDVSVSVAASYVNIPVALAVLSQDLSLSTNTVSGNIFCGRNLSLTGCQISGDIYVKGNVSISGGSLTGNIYADGSVTLSGSGTQVSGDIHSGGTVTLSGTGTLNGNIYSTGGVSVGGAYSGIRNINTGGNFTATSTFGAQTIRAGGYVSIPSGSGSSVSGSASSNGYFQVGGGVTFGGSLYSGSYVSITSASSPVSGDVYASGNVLTNSRVYGLVHTTGTVSGSGPVGGIVSESYTASYVYQDPSYNYDAAVNGAPEWALGAIPPNSVTLLNNRTVTNTDTRLYAGNASVNMLTLRSTQSSPMTVYLDKTSQTISNLVVSNSGPIYFFLRSAASVTISSVQKSGGGALFIIGQNGANLSMGNWGSPADVYLYTPSGRVTSTSNTSSFTGRVVAGTQTNLYRLRSVALGTSPSLAGTPFENIVRKGSAGGASSTTYTWTGNVVYSGS